MKIGDNTIAFFHAFFMAYLVLILSNPALFLKFFDAGQILS